MQENNQHIVEDLRATLLHDIQLQEEVRVLQQNVINLFKKILRRLSVVFITMSASLLMGIIYIIYMMSQPASKTETAMKQVQDISYNLLMQRKFIEMDRQDVAIARAQLTELLRMEDSVKRAKDSISKTK